jgi:cysteate synthase
MRNYKLVCTACGAIYEDDGVRLQCSSEHGPALLRSEYVQRSFEPGTADSMLRFDRWLPGARDLATSARTGVYHSTVLGSHLGLPKLWIAFSGWWPERGATLPTGTFKDLEAVSVLRRIQPGDTRTLVLSSAGNTALAFARVCTENNLPALIVVPLKGWNEVMSHADVGPSVRVVAIADIGYEETIAFAREVCANGEFILEGGVRNVGRRDGMGTALLAAVEAIGTLPDYYFQAVGSAAGALAAHEAALRVRADGRFGSRVPRLMLSQNAPFTPLHDAWQAGSPFLIPRTAETTASQLAQIGAFVLSNQAPPYAPTGGVREALIESAGKTYAISNTELKNAQAVFAELEGVSIEPAAGVALASLIRAVRSGQIEPDANVLLHVTGGGRAALPGQNAAQGLPTLVIPRGDLATTAVESARSLLR